MAALNLQTLKPESAPAPAPGQQAQPQQDWIVRAKQAADAITAVNAVLVGTGQQVDVLAVLTGIGVPLKPGETATTRREIFSYDIELGIVTIDEARAAKGLQPLPNGEGDRYYQPPQPPA